VEYQIAHHFEGSRSRSHDNAGPDLGDRHVSLAQQVAGALAGDDVLGVGGRWHQPAQIHDAAHACGGRCRREIGRGLEVDPAKVAAGGHRVHQVVGRIDITQCGFQGLRLQRIGGNAFDPGPFTGLENLR